jgi:hypothetical protein
MSLPHNVNENKMLDAYATIRRECTNTKLDLADALSECKRRIRGNGMPLSLPGEREDVTFDQCYKGPDHLSCTLVAIKTEAEAINSDYKDVVDPRSLVSQRRWAKRV